MLIWPHAANASDPLIEKKTSRSIVAESALTIELAATGRVPRTFADTMLDQATGDLESSAKKLANDRPAADLLTEAIARISARDVPALRVIAARLLALEKTDEQSR
jgi:hypothetical protein